MIVDNYLLSDESGEGFGRVELFSSEWPTNQSDTLTYTFCNGSAFNASGSQVRQFVNRQFFCSEHFLLDFARRSSLPFR